MMTKTENLTLHTTILHYLFMNDLPDANPEPLSTAHQQTQTWTPTLGYEEGIGNKGVRVSEGVSEREGVG